MHPKDVEGIANSVDPDRTAPRGAVWFGSALFAQTYEGHLESSGNSEIFQSRKQDPVYFSYQCKRLYLFFPLMILLTYFIPSVQSYRPL